MEDDPGIRMALVDNLGAEGYRVSAVRDLAAAFQSACAGGVDLVVLDRMLPDGDGLELLRALRRRGATVPVLMLTARGEESDRVAGLRVGADDYVVKPFSMAELRARVAAILKRTRLSAGVPIQIGAAELDVDARVLRRGGAAVELTRREFDLLAHLAGRPGRACTRGDLLDAVWGVGYEGGERVVDRFVVALRKKLEADPGRPRHLVTVPGVGYRLDP
ncbi:MAG: response regulator transcription factor [Planctomycetes bacterium]|nr:response regulator transcription factor [Planctomycetota bacterium]